MDTTMPLDTQSRFDADLSERVTRVESAVETLTNSMTRMITSIENIERVVAGVGKTDFKTIIGIVGTVGPILVASLYIFIAPLNVQMVNAIADIDKLERTQALYVTLPSDGLRLEGSINTLRNKVEDLEKRGAVNDERTRLTHELMRDMANTQKPIGKMR